MQNLGYFENEISFLDEISIFHDSIRTTIWWKKKKKKKKKKKRKITDTRFKIYASLRFFTDLFKSLFILYEKIKKWGKYGHAMLRPLLSENAKLFLKKQHSLET